MTERICANCRHHPPRPLDPPCRPWCHGNPNHPQFAPKEILVPSTRKFTPKLGGGFELITDDGESFPARITCTDVKNRGPIAFLYEHKGQEWDCLADLDGVVISGMNGRLYDAPVVEDRWVNVYHELTAPIRQYATREEADEGRNRARSHTGLLHFQIIDGKPSNPEFVE